MAAGIPGLLVCNRADVRRGRLSDIENGLVQPSEAEMNRLEAALSELEDAQSLMKETAAKVGWPLERL